MVLFYCAYRRRVVAMFSPIQSVHHHSSCFAVRCTSQSNHYANLVWMFFHITSANKKIRTLQFHAGFIFINEVSIVKLELYYHELRFIALHLSQLLILHRWVSGSILASGHRIDLRLKCILLLMWNSCAHNVWNVVSSNEIGSRTKKKHGDIASNWRHCIISTPKSIVFFFSNSFCRTIEGVDWV